MPVKTEGFDLEFVEKMKGVLDSLEKKPKPVVQPKITKVKLMEMLSSELVQAMEKKHYTAEEIAGVLKEKGLEVSALTVKRATAGKRKQKKRVKPE